ncbi:MAG: hypothetical protein OJF62_000358 [Pseudolabrys sp.]|nr:hypothetical protein [Pseudolabrys sp.]
MLCRGRARDRSLYISNRYEKQSAGMTGKSAPFSGAARQKLPVAMIC